MSVRRMVVVVGCLLFLPAAARAQVASATITGVVKDTSGAVMPGVTVEAASPALIEKIRSVVSDEQGQYRIVNLVPGAHTVTFTLTGFGTAAAVVHGDGECRAEGRDARRDGDRFGGGPGRGHAERPTADHGSASDAGRAPDHQTDRPICDDHPGGHLREPDLPRCRRHGRRGRYVRGPRRTHNGRSSQYGGHECQRDGRRNLQLQQQHLPGSRPPDQWRLRRKHQRRRPGEHRAEGRRQHILRKLEWGVLRPEPAK
ncbi:MAG: hypothetical protein DMF92_14235 [Acidobacteria bacterium]|nr:MAG: hypothetical protein DMF92_14235 [Acidobacteriota bacterium]